MRLTGYILAIALAMTAPALGQTSSGKVTTAAPTYVNNTAAPLSLDTSGNLRTVGTFTPSGTQNVNVTQWGSAATTLGQKVMASSVPVVLASDQAAIPVSQSGTWNVGTVTTVTTVSTVTLLSNTTQLTPGTAAANLGKAEDAVHNSSDTGVFSLGVANDAYASMAANGDYVSHATNDKGATIVTNGVSTLSTTITRPADTNAYAANDAFSNSTSAPTSGGYTLTSACAASGGFGTIQSAVITASAATNYYGEIWIFDQAVTNINDNAAFTITDGEAQTLVGIIPFNTSDITAANSVSYVTGLNIGYTCVGTANLRFIVKIMQAATPGNAEVLSVRVQVQN